MRNEEHLGVLLQEVQTWNLWKREQPETLQLDLSGADLIEAKLYKADLRKVGLSWVNLRGADLREADLREANMTGTDLTDAHLGRADLRGAKLRGAILTWSRARGAKLSQADLNGAGLTRAKLDGADLGGADLSGANLTGAYLRGANLTGANLCCATLAGADLSRAKLSGADFDKATIISTTFNDVDLSEVKRLNTTHHLGASFIGIDTIYRSGGNIPENFLRDARVPEHFIIYIRSIVEEAPRFYSCFISYSTKDEEFAQRLYSRMSKEKIPVWFAPKDLKGGEEIHKQIYRAIQTHDKLLVVLSDNSINSDWVISEVRQAQRAESVETRRKLFPIRLVDLKVLREWECFDADSGKDIAAEVRKFFIPDFSNWKNNDTFEAAFERLLRDLKAGEEKV